MPVALRGAGLMAAPKKLSGSVRHQLKRPPQFFRHHPECLSQNKSPMPFKLQCGYGCVCLVAGNVPGSPLEWWSPKLMD